MIHKHIKAAIEICLWFAALIITRVYSYSPYLYSWDAIQFALSFEHYDISMHRPHPPGYLYYSFAGRFLNFVFGDANLSLVILNNLFTAGALFFLIRLVSTLLSEESSALRFIASRGAAAIYLTNPVSWFYGSIAEMYAAEGFFLALLLYLFVQAGKNRRNLYWSSFVLGMAGAFRPSTEILLLPVFFFLMRGKSRTFLLKCAGILIIANLLWFVPVVWISGGLHEYFQISKAQFLRASSNKGFSEDQEGSAALRLTAKFLQGVSVPLLTSLLLRVKRIRLAFNERILIASTFFPALFFLFIHFPKDGYFMILLPSVVALTCIMLSQTYKSKAALIALIAATCLLNIRIFLVPDIFVPGRPEVLNAGKEWIVQYFSPNRLMINYHRRRLEIFREQIRQLGDGQILFVFEESHTFPNRRTTEYYFPQHQSLEILPNKRRARLIENKWPAIVPAPLLIDPSIHWIVLITGERPEFMQDTIYVFDRRFPYVNARKLPRRFQISGFDFVRARAGKSQIHRRERRVR